MSAYRRTAQISERLDPPKETGSEGATSATRGVSLVELMMVLVLLATFFGVGYESVIAGLRTTQAADNREGLRQAVANALEWLTREAGVASAVDVAEDQQFQFDADVNGDGALEQDISYEVQNGVLRRRYSGGTITLVNGLADFALGYVDVEGKAMKTPVAKKQEDIRVVQMTITATKGDETVSVATAVYLRNNQ